MILLPSLRSSHWSSNGQSNGPAFAESLVDRCVRSIESSGPFSHRQRLAFGCENPVVAFVSSLLTSCGPEAILRRIGTVIVAPFKRRPFRARPHVGVENRKRLAPTITHGDSSAAIVLKRMICVFVTSAFRMRPRSILWALCEPVSSFCLRDKGSARAAATLTAFSQQIGTVPFNGSTADAAASPATAEFAYTLPLRRTALHDQQSEGHSSKVHGLILSRGSYQAV